LNTSVVLLAILPTTLQTFEQAADTLFEGHTRRSKFLADIRHIGSDANAEYKTTFRDLIESRHLVCQEDWIA
jgi:hypothetical protein